MPNTLLLRLSAPMQSWGVASRFSIRDTGKEPSKSAVIGLLCAALGISRSEANSNNPQFAELMKLKMGVRVNREGILQKDYHTAQKVAIASGGTPKPTELSTRHYLADADFLVGLESEDLQFLESLRNALENPRWQLFLGRKAFVPSVPIHIPNGLKVGVSLENALQDFELEDFVFDSEILRIILEDETGTEVRQDTPLSFTTRRFLPRRVKTDFIPIPKGGNEDD